MSTTTIQPTPKSDLENDENKLAIDDKDESKDEIATTCTVEELFARIEDIVNAIPSEECLDSEDYLVEKTTAESGAMVEEKIESWNNVFRPFLKRTNNNNDDNQVLDDDEPQPPPNKKLKKEGSDSGSDRFHFQLAKEVHNKQLPKFTHYAMRICAEYANCLDVGDLLREELEEGNVDDIANALLEADEFDNNDDGSAYEVSFE